MAVVVRTDPRIWATLRAEWEDNPKMTMSDCAKRIGVSVTAVSKHVRKEGWAKVVVTDIDRVVYTPRQLAEIAIRSLVRAATQTQDIASSVKASQLLLERTMGRVVAEQIAPLISPDELEGMPNEPEWLTARRLAYQEGAVPSDDGYEEPTDPALYAPEPVPEPEPPQTLPEPPARPVEPLGRLHLVEPAPPKFWDGPNRPART